MQMRKNRVKNKKQTSQPKRIWDLENITHRPIMFVCVI